MQNEDSMLNGIGTGSIVAGKFRLEEKLGQGSFGMIYRCTNVEIASGETGAASGGSAAATAAAAAAAAATATNTNASAAGAIKIEKRNNRHSSMIVREIKVMLELKNEFGFARMISCGQDDDFNFVVMTALGRNLDSIFKKCSNRFSLATCMNVAEQLITRLEVLHSHNLIHRDIKPENFVVGPDRNFNHVYLIDFGLAKYYKDNDGMHIAPVEKKGMIGTARYASVNAHLGLEQSRRDDLEAVGYVLLYLIRGKLPWQQIFAETKEEKYEKIKSMKMNQPLESICEGCPIELVQYLKQVRKLEFSETPNYAALKQLFKKVIVDKRLETASLSVDWEALPDYRHRKKNMNIIQLPQIPTQKEIAQRQQLSRQLLLSKSLQKVQVDPTGTQSKSQSPQKQSQAKLDRQLQQQQQQQQADNNNNNILVHQTSILKLNQIKTQHSLEHPISKANTGSIEMRSHIGTNPATSFSKIDLNQQLMSGQQLQQQQQQQQQHQQQQQQQQRENQNQHRRTNSTESGGKFASSLLNVAAATATAGSAGGVIGGGAIGGQENQSQEVSQQNHSHLQQLYSQQSPTSEKQQQQQHQQQQQQQLGQLPPPPSLLNVNLLSVPGRVREGSHSSQGSQNQTSKLNNYTWTDSDGVDDEGGIAISTSIIDKNANLITTSEMRREIRTRSLVIRMSQLELVGLGIGGNHQNAQYYQPSQFSNEQTVGRRVTTQSLQQNQLLQQQQNQEELQRKLFEEQLRLQDENSQKEISLKNFHSQVGQVVNLDPTFAFDKSIPLPLHPSSSSSALFSNSKLHQQSSSQQHTPLNQSGGGGAGGFLQKMGSSSGNYSKQPYSAETTTADEMKQDQLDDDLMTLSARKHNKTYKTQFTPITEVKESTYISAKTKTSRGGGGVVAAAPLASAAAGLNASGYFSAENISESFSEQPIMIQTLSVRMAFSSKQ